MKIDTFAEHLVADRFGRVHGGEDAVDLLVAVDGEEASEIAKDPAHLIESVLTEVALNLDQSAGQTTNRFGRWYNAS
jgi:hypothetical protein